MRARVTYQSLLDAAGHGLRYREMFFTPARHLADGQDLGLLPLIGHTRGHCGVAIRTDTGWLFHVGDAAPMGLEVAPPAWFVGMVLGPPEPRLRRFRDTHSEVRMTTGHMFLDYFRATTTADGLRGRLPPDRPLLRATRMVFV